jgi:hypothetical protein
LSDEVQGEMGAGRAFQVQRLWLLLMLWILAAHAAKASAPEADFRGRKASSEARLVAAWATRAGNAQGKPFAIVDKREARLFVFTADGRLIGDTAALLGITRGDANIALNGRPITDLAPNERTTPAGRFESEPGRNDKGEAIVWFDYDAALAIHRLRPVAAKQRRAQRLSTDAADDNRISLGCVVVDEAFYDMVVAPTLGRQRGVVYVLPETRAAWSWFDMTVGAID